MAPKYIELRNVRKTIETKNSLFWENGLKENNQKTWRSQEINISYLNKTDNESLQKSWFDIKEAKNTNYEHKRYLLDRDRFEKVKIPKEDAKTEIKIEKVGLKLTKDQKVIIKQWFGITRYIYNLCIDLLSGMLKEYKRTKISRPMDRQILRDTIIGKDKNRLLEDWVYKCPSDVRHGASDDALKAYEAVIRNRAEGKKSRLTYRKKKDDNSISITIKSISKKGELYPRKLGKIKLKNPKSNTKINGISRLVYSKTSGYVLHKVIKNVVEISKFNSENQRITAIAVDPGVRTFLTAYSPEIISDIGNNASEKLMKLKNAKGKIMKLSENVNARKRKRMKLACAKIQKKIKNLTDELHWKTINYLMKFNVIILPEFKVQAMARRSNFKTGALRKIPRCVVSRMLLLSHGKFRDRLINKVRQSKRNSLYLVNESYTSKTCSDCGAINTKLGGSKTFDCEECLMTLDRDVNGARNIFNKYIRIQ